MTSLLEFLKFRETGYQERTELFHQLAPRDRSDAAVRIQSGRALVSRTLWPAQLVASDGRMNVTNERPSVESDEETFIDQHGRSLHLVGADVLHERERPNLLCLMALPDS